jgi:transcriptional regulator with XRE-family HTH domain
MEDQPGEAMGVDNTLSLEFVALSDLLQPVIGNTIKVLRESRGVTQKQLSERSGFSQSTLSRLESGLLNVEVRMIDCVLRVLKYPPSALSKGGLLTVAKSGGSRVRTSTLQEIYQNSKNAHQIEIEPFTNETGTN